MPDAVSPSISPVGPSPTPAPTPSTTGLTAGVYDIAAGVVSFTDGDGTVISLGAGTLTVA